MLVTGCVRFDRIGRALSAKVIVLVAASLAIGRIVLDSGAAEWISLLIALGLQFLPAAGVLGALMLFVTISPISHRTRQQRRSEHRSRSASRRSWAFPSSL